MKGFRAALLDENGQSLSETEELAHVLASTYRDLGSPRFFPQARALRIWGIGLMCAVALLPIDLLLWDSLPGPVWNLLAWCSALLPAIGAALFAWSMLRKPKFRVTRVGKAYWVGAFYDFEGGQVLVDKSQLTEPTDFHVPVPAESPEAMVQLSEEARHLVENPPVLVPRSQDGRGTLLGAAANDPVAGVKDDLLLFARSLENAREEAVSMNVLPAQSPLAKAMAQAVNGAEEVVPRNTVIGKDAPKIEEQLRDLGKLTSIARSATSYSASVEELAEHVAQEFEATVNRLDEIQRVSMIDILQKLLSRLEAAYRAPMFLYYCPACLERTAQGLELGLNDLLAVAADAPGAAGASTLLEGETQQRLSETARDFAAGSKAAVMRMELRSNRGASERVWRCGLCNRTYPVDDPTIVHAYRAKQELVLPLWDQLWMELSTERAGLLERKDKEQRDNVQREHQEAVQAADQFAAERREMKGRMDDLAASTIRAVEVFSFLIESFLESSVLEPSDVAGDQQRLESYRRQYLAKLEQLDNRIAAAEDKLQKETEESLDRRHPILDFPDQVKLRSHFLPQPAKEQEELVIEEARPALSSQ